MADPLSLTASVIGVASAGLRLSGSLYRYTENVINADKTVKGIARDLSTTSSLIRELGTLLGQDRGGLQCESALSTAHEALLGCDEVFKDIQKVLDDNMDLVEKGNSAISKLKRLRWPLVEPRIHVLHLRLERLKNTLVLILSVVNYAKEARERTVIEDRPSIISRPSQLSTISDGQYPQVERLISLNEEANARSQYLEMMVRRLELMLMPRAPMPLNRGASKHVQCSYQSPHTGDMNESFDMKAAQLNSSSRASDTSSCICGQSTPSKAGSLHLSRQDLGEYANHARALLKAIEEAETAQNKTGQCETVQINCKESLDALKGLVDEETKKSTRFRRLFLANRQRGEFGRRRFHHS